jgi:hypothetical protein
MAVPSTVTAHGRTAFCSLHRGQCASGHPFPLRLRQEKLDALYASSFSDE